MDAHPNRPVSSTVAAVHGYFSPVSNSTSSGRQGTVVDGDTSPAVTRPYAPSIEILSTAASPVAMQSIAPREPSASSEATLVGHWNPGAAPFAQSPLHLQKHTDAESVWKQRVRDRDDVVRDLMRRIVQLEQENNVLKLELDDVAFRRNTAKSTGTNTSHEWVVEEHQRQQLIALEEHMRFQDVCLYAEWFGLCLAFHRQVFHVVRGESQLQQVSEQLNNGLLITTPSSAASAVSSPQSGPALADNRSASAVEPPGRLMRLYGFVEAPNTALMTSSAAPLKAGIGYHTPSSATGAALHLLRGIDAIQCRYVDRCTNEIVHGLHVITRKNRSLLTAAAAIHESVVSIAYDELRARREVEHAALEGAMGSYQTMVARSLLHAAERQVQLLSRENKRMLEFAVEESTSHHLVREQLLLEQGSRHEEGQHRDRQMLTFQETTLRHAHVEAFEADARRVLEGIVFGATQMSAEAVAALHHHAIHLEGASISLRHGEEPSLRRLLASTEVATREWLHDVHDNFISNTRATSEAAQLRGALTLEAEALQAKELVGASLLQVHANVLHCVHADVLGHLDRCVAAAVQQSVDSARSGFALQNIEAQCRLQQERDAANDWLRVTNAETAAAVGAAANGFCQAQLNQMRHTYGRDMIALWHVLRRDVHEAVGATMSTSSNLVADVLLDANGAIVRQQSLHRRTLRAERDEQKRRADLLVQEEREYFHRALLPFVLALRETELNDEYGSMFVNIEDQTRRIMRRAVEREAGFLTYYAEEGLIGCHVELGEGLMTQHLETMTAFGWFIRDHLQKAERRSIARSAAEVQKEVQRVALAAAAAQEAQRHEASEHLEHVRQTTNQFWQDVFSTEVVRVRASWVRFASTELIAWRRLEQEEWLRFTNGCLHAFRRFHAAAQGGLLSHVMQGPVVDLLAAQQDASIEMCSGVLLSARRFEAGHHRADRATQDNVRELLDLKEVRLKQQVHHGERLYMECRHQLDKEVQLREYERQGTWIVLEEQKRRSHVLNAEGYDVLWLVYRALTVQRFLTQTGGVGNGAQNRMHWTPRTTAVTGATSPQNRPYHHQELHHYADGGAGASQYGPTSPRSPYAIAGGSAASRNASAAAAASMPNVTGNPSPLTSSALALANAVPTEEPGAATTAQRGHSFMMQPATTRSDSPGSSIFGGGGRSDHMQMEGPNASGSLARARRSSLVMSRSMERQRAIRGEGNVDPSSQHGSPDARFSDAVAAVVAAGGRHTTSDGVAMDAFSPSPSTRSFLLAQHERRVQTQLNLI